MSCRCILACFLVFGLGCTAMASPLRLGVVTDIHVHDTDSPNQHAVMTNYAERLDAFVAAMIAWPADAVFELGDLVNGAFVLGAPLGDPARIAGLLDTAVGSLERFPGPLYYVLGNHDVYNLSKTEFLETAGAPSTTSSFDLAGYHLVLLDAQFSKAGQDYENITWMVQGTVPAVELEWLRADLAATILPTIVFIHQPLDVEYELEAGGPSVSNRSEVQAVLAESGHVIAVFQGHSHVDRVTVQDRIHYVTFAALVDRDEPTPPSWAAITLDPDARTVRIDGEGLQDGVEFAY